VGRKSVATSALSCVLAASPAASNTARVVLNMGATRSHVATLRPGPTAEGGRPGASGAGVGGGDAATGGGAEDFCAATKHACCGQPAQSRQPHAEPQQRQAKQRVPEEDQMMTEAKRSKRLTRAREEGGARPLQRTGFSDAVLFSTGLAATGGGLTACAPKEKAGKRCDARILNEFGALQLLGNAHTEGKHAGAHQLLGLGLGSSGRRADGLEQGKGASGASATTRDLPRTTHSLFSRRRVRASHSTKGAAPHRLLGCGALLHGLGSRRRAGGLQWQGGKRKARCVGFSFSARRRRRAATACA
jgi:hypothetical protein